MVNMYPHKLYVVSAGSSRNASGYVVTSSIGEVSVGQCRLETNGRGTEVRREDGSFVVCHHTIYCPKSVCACGIKSKTLIKVCDGSENVLLTGEVVNIIKSQMHIRIWV